MLISVLGAGYVGLVTAAGLANLGNTIRCVDTSLERISLLKRGELPFQEPGLAESVEASVASERLSFHQDATAVHGTELVIVAVGTLDVEGEWSDEVVRAAVLDLARDPRAPRTVVIRSTLLPGTAVSMESDARAIDPSLELGLNPEFTREGSAVNDFLNPERVVVGVREPAGDSRVAQMLSHLYEPFGAPIIVTDLTSAETIKVASNVFLAAKITFANELARLSEATGADVQAVVDGMGLDKRIGRQFLSPGPGFGGSCFPSQARALPALAASLGVRAPMMSAIWASNADHAAWLVEQAELGLGRSLRGAHVALLGLTFKAGTDDLRESPALRLGQLLAEERATLALYDPSGDGAVAALAGAGVAAKACPDAIAACTGADIIMVATEWPEFHELDWEKIADVAAGRLVVDARNVIDASRAAAAGFDVRTMGISRGSRSAIALATG
jgi:UDPglucose 6-dehydrogenase